MKTILLSLTLGLALAFAAGCKSSATHTTSTQATETKSLLTDLNQVSKSADEISVMEYNVENLFDTLHDKGTEDYPNLPLSVKKKSKEVQKFCAQVKNPYYRKSCFELDWNDNVLAAKLKNLGQVIKSVDDGHGPDNLMMEEVENLHVLKELVKTQLGDLGYKTVVLIEGPDLRGIDPAFISKFPSVGKPKLHIIPYTDPDPKQLKWARRSRGILEVTVQAPNKENITFLVAHFPSQANPTAWRAQAVAYAKKLMEEYAKQGKAVIFGGDLNIIKSEETEHRYFENVLSEAGQVSHFIGCKDCIGSHYYHGDWSFLDALVFGKGLAAHGFEAIPESIHVLRTLTNTRPDGTPLSFREESLTGASDHLPLYTRLKVLKK